MPAAVATSWAAPKVRIRKEECKWGAKAISKCAWLAASTAAAAAPPCATSGAVSLPCPNLPCPNPCRPLAGLLPALGFAHGGRLRSLVAAAVQRQL